MKKFEATIFCSTVNNKSKEPKYPPFATFGGFGIALVIHGNQEFFKSGKNYKLTIGEEDD